MLNIISLTALRNKVTWPGKVVKNLMKWLDILGYPYILNRQLNATQRLWIHDDFFALKHLRKIDVHTKVIIGPNLYALPRAVPVDLSIDQYPNIMPSDWVVDFWKHFWYAGILESWPVGIDTEVFLPSEEKRTKVLVYLKQRKDEDLNAVRKVLSTKNIEYEILVYGSYSESQFQELLRSTKYAIWIGCSESQWIALGEILASNIPVLLWDIERFDQCSSALWAFTDEEFHYAPVTAAPYFDTSCWIRVLRREELSEGIGMMESQWTEFTPRIYIEKNLSLSGQAKKFIELYDKHYHLTYNSWLNEACREQKSFRSNSLITTLFDIYDSRLISRIRKILR